MYVLCVLIWIPLTAYSFIRWTWIFMRINSIYVRDHYNNSPWVEVFVLMTFEPNVNYDAWKFFILSKYTYAFLNDTIMSCRCVALKYLLKLKYFDYNIWFCRASPWLDLVITWNNNTVLLCGKCMGMSYIIWATNDISIGKWRILVLRVIQTAGTYSNW